MSSRRCARARDSPSWASAEPALRVDHVQHAGIAGFETAPRQIQRLGGGALGFVFRRHAFRIIGQRLKIVGDFAESATSTVFSYSARRCLIGVDGGAALRR